MARELAANVAVDGQWYGPSYPDNDPAGIADRITNPKAWGEEGTVETHPTGPPADEAPEVTVNPTLGAEDGPAPPPHGGPGSGKAAWAEYAAAVGVDVSEGAERSEIIDAVKSAGKPVE